MRFIKNNAIKRAKDQRAKIDHLFSRFIQKSQTQIYERPFTKRAFAIKLSGKP
ncbi:hypothetical protein PAMC26577_18650 [Caballeronia sordidicola]|uniref:Uncharacterized protein n=1 Tax=Caballeronia sordidicola TaxID=196367 RepID=A0A242MQU5_CABSO|nr:hypothetical protein PAMC26577_18650 [Caballeronia sordidicola]